MPDESKAAAKDTACSAKKKALQTCLTVSKMLSSYGFTADTE